MSAGDYTGGICGESQDIYLIEETGNWRATLQFDSSVGQLGMVSIPLNDLNTFEESTVVNDNQQIIESSGEMYLGIYGIENASAPYSLSIEVIE